MITIFYVLNVLSALVLLASALSEGTFGLVLKRFCTLKFSPENSELCSRTIERFERSELKIDYNECDSINAVLTNGTANYYVCIGHPDTEFFGLVSDTKFEDRNGQILVSPRVRIGAINSSAFRKVLNLQRTTRAVHEKEVL